LSYYLAIFIILSLKSLAFFASAISLVFTTYLLAFADFYLTAAKSSTLRNIDNTYIIVIISPSKSICFCYYTIISFITCSFRFLKVLRLDSVSFSSYTKKDFFLYFFLMRSQSSSRITSHISFGLHLFRNYFMRSSSLP
jgi:hypothetical protein